MLVSAISQHESAIGIHISSPSWISFPPPSHPTPLGCHRALGWAPCIIQRLPTGCLFYRWYCKCFSATLNLSHPPLPPLCPQVSSLGLHLYSYPANRFTGTIFLDSIYALICSIFPDSIYALICSIYFSLSDFILYNRLQVHPPKFNWLIFVPFYDWIIFCCIHVAQLLYPLICRWTSNLFSCPGYCKECCNEHWGTRENLCSNI